MLSWSAKETGRQVDVRAIATSCHDSGVEGGAEHIALGRAVVEPDPESAVSAAVESALGRAAAADAAGIAAAFELLNRVVDAAGLPIGPGTRKNLAHLVDALDLGRFPHAGH
jgi:hypothetical protein